MYKQPQAVPVRSAVSIPKVLLLSVRADIGGGPEHVYQIIRKLKDRVDFHCALPRQAPFFQRVEEEGVAIFELPVRKFRISALFGLRAYIARQGIEIVHSHGRGAGVYSRALKWVGCDAAVVHTFHGIHFAGWEPTFFLDRALAKSTEIAICVSASEQRRARKLGFAPRRGLQLIENGVETDNLPAAGVDASREVGSASLTADGDRPFMIGTLSRFQAIKNIGYAIEHLADYLRQNPVRYLLGGDGVEWNKIARLVRKLHLEDRVIMLGFVRDREAFFERLDVYLSTSRSEAFGLSVVEAMARGIPVVASRVPGSVDVVADGTTGLLFNLHQPHTLPEALEKLRPLDERYREFSAAAIAHARKRFSLHRMCDQLHTLYRSLAPCE